MQKNNGPQLPTAADLRLAVLIIAPLLIYAMLVFWHAWSLKASSHFYSALNTTLFHECLKKHHSRKAPNSDLSIWLFDDYEEITFDHAILSDTECIGKLVILGNQFIANNPQRHQLVVRLMDPATENIRSRIIIKP